MIFRSMHYNSQCVMKMPEFICVRINDKQTFIVPNWILMSFFCPHYCNNCFLLLCFPVLAALKSSY